MTQRFRKMERKVQGERERESEAGAPSVPTVSIGHDGRQPQRYRKAGLASEILKRAVKQRREE